MIYDMIWYHIHTYTNLIESASMAFAYLLHTWFLDLEKQSLARTTWSEHVTNLTKEYPREGCVLDHLAVNSDVRAINTPSIVASHRSLAKHTCTQRHTHTHTPPSPSIKRFPGELFSRSHPVSKQKEVVGVALLAAEGKSRKERGRSVSRLEGFLVRLINPSTHPWGVHHGSRREAYCRTFIFSTQNRLGLVFCLGQLLPKKAYDPVKSTWIHHVQWGIHLAKGYQRSPQKGISTEVVPPKTSAEYLGVAARCHGTVLYVFLVRMASKMKRFFVPQNRFYCRETDDQPWDKMNSPFISIFFEVSSILCKDTPSRRCESLTACQTSSETNGFRCSWRRDSSSILRVTRWPFQEPKLEVPTKFQWLRHQIWLYRRKFRSQTSDKMDRWSSPRWEEDGRDRRETVRREEVRRERLSREKSRCTKR